jgi:hypothetical protein
LDGSRFGDPLAVDVHRLRGVDHDVAVLVVGAGALDFDGLVPAVRPDRAQHIFALPLAALDLGGAPAARVRRRRADVPALRRPPPPHRTAHRPSRRAQDPRAPRTAHRASTARASSLTRTARVRLRRRSLPRRARSSPATRAGEFDPACPRCHSPPENGHLDPPRRRSSPRPGALHPPQLSTEPDPRHPRAQGHPLGRPIPGVADRRATHGVPHAAA